MDEKSYKTKKRKSSNPERLSTDFYIPVSPTVETDSAASAEDSTLPPGTTSLSDTSPI